MTTISEKSFITGLFLGREKELLKSVSDKYGLNYDEMVDLFGSSEEMNFIREERINNMSSKNRCQALVWGNGEYPQCTRKCKGEGDYPQYCGTHGRQLTINGCLTNGSVDNPPKRVEKKSDKKRKKKDPDAPKRGMPAFMYFSNEMREKVKSENPVLKFTEIGKKLGEMWSSMSEEEKDPYNKRSKEDRERYMSEKKEYMSKQKPRVKRGKSAYIYFTMEKREIVSEANGDLSFGGVTAKLAEMWRALSDEDREPYLVKSKKDKERYEKEKESV